MNILRLRLVLPSIVGMGFVVANGNISEYVGSYVNHVLFDYGLSPNTEFKFPPIKMTVLECAFQDISKCFFAEPDTWSYDNISGILIGDFPFWQLSEISFSRYTPRLRFHCEGVGDEDIYISKEANIILRFEVYRGEGLSPFIYTMFHNRRDNYGYMVSVLIEMIDDVPTRLFEFGLETACTHDNGRKSGHTAGKEYLIVTEFH